MRLLGTVGVGLRSSALVVAGVLSAALVASAPAQAQSPWWHLTAEARPGHLSPSGQHEEVQELSVSATGGDVFIAEPQSLSEFEKGERSVGELVYVDVPYNASAAQLQQALATTLYPGRNVTVTEKPIEENTRTYVISFPGVAPIVANESMAMAFGGEPLSCRGAVGACTGGAEVTETSRGSVSGDIVVTAANLGDADSGGQVNVAARLPGGVIPISAEGISGEDSEEGPAGSDGPVTCSPHFLSCGFTGALHAFHQIEMRIGVIVEPSAGKGGVVEASVSGGGGAAATIDRHIDVSREPTPFGVSEYAMAAEEEGGVQDRQAGSHPFQLTTTFTLNQVLEGGSEGLPQPVSLTKDMRFMLPPGLIGNPTPFRRCTLADFVSFIGNSGENNCSPQTVVGIARIMLTEKHFVGLRTFRVPVFNLEPAVGEPARFGFTVAANPVILDTSVRTGGDYGVTVSVDNVIQTAGFMRSEVTFWGVPGDTRHDAQRGWGCLLAESGRPHRQQCNPTEPSNPPPLLSMPTSCTGPLSTSVEVDSWAQKGSFQLVPAGESMAALNGCNRLPFSSSIEVAPDGQAGSTPTGLSVDVHVPQEEALNPTGLAPAEVRNTTVALPAGVAINPAGGDGLQACSQAQIALSKDAADTCPEASKVGTVEIETPLLPNPLVGAAYLADQAENPFGSLVALYVVAEDPISGSLVKIAGEVKPDPVTGQLVSTFLNTPQLPFEDFKLHFFGGDRAPLGTPSLCGAYTTTASIEPWSGNPPSESSSTFDVTSGPNGGPCYDPLQFNPTLTAGTTSIQAGGFSPFTNTITREDGQQSIKQVTLHMPPGLSGLLSGVELCGEAQANAGTCGPNSLIGETIVSVGLGGDPFSVKGGRVYITGPYKGAPFGLSIVNPAKAGPFDLEKDSACDCVLVRAKVDVDPITAALTVTTDGSGPGEHPIPTILKGIPLQIKHVNVTITRPGFTFNPTNCSPTQITGSVTSTEGTSSPVSVPFQVTNCAVLGFKPSFKTSTSGKTSRSQGASLHVLLTYPKAPFGSQANIGSVKVDLPKQLPSRLTTLQLACTEQQFSVNPAGCPAASRVGSAKAITPLIPVPLEGPAYFVSHGGAKFPELIVVLQGYGVTIELHGETFISKAGITSSTFHAIPDAPVGSFELTLPEGPYSALAAPGGLCNITKTKIVKKKVTVRSKGHTRRVTRKVKEIVPGGLIMPTAFTAQNGMTIHQNTPIEVTGCARAKRAKASSHRHKKK